MRSPVTVLLAFLAFAPAVRGVPATAFREDLAFARTGFAGTLDPLRGSRKPDPGTGTVRDRGHPLLLTAALPRAVDWLLARRLPE